MYRNQYPKTTLNFQKGSRLQQSPDEARWEDILKGFCKSLTFDRFLFEALGLIHQFFAAVSYVFALEEGD